MIYTLRPGPFLKPASWRLADGALVETRHGREKVWPLADLRAVRIADGANRYVPHEKVARLSFAKGATSFSSHSFLGLAQYADQSPAFGAFVRAVCDEGRALAPQARFEAGTVRGEGLLSGAMAILAGGTLLVIFGAVTAGALSLGADISARLAFVLILMFAVSPWLPSGRLRTFDPQDIPRDVLP